MAKKRKAVYVGFFVNDRSKYELGRWWRETYGEMLPKEFMHHVTLRFKPMFGEVVSLPMGAQIRMRITGVAQDDKAAAVRVDRVLNPELPMNALAEYLPAGKIPHLTVATDGDTPPKYSNELLAAGVTEIDGPEFDVQLGFFNGRTIQYNFNGSIYEPQKYRIKEWDDTTDVVDVHKHGDDVWMTYPDGVQHLVSLEHFETELRPIPR